MKAYEFKMTLLDSETSIWRRFIIPADIKFQRLHDAIQIIMGWYGDHLFQFTFKEGNLRFTDNEQAIEENRFIKSDEGKRIIAANPESVKYINTKETVYPPTYKIDRYINKYNKFNYVYDFGDWWEFEIELLNIHEDYKFGYPLVLDFSGNNPPQDCGGVGGYEEVLEIIKDPSHPDYDHIKEWLDHELIEFRLPHINEMLEFLVKLKIVKTT